MHDCTIILKRYYSILLPIAAIAFTATLSGCGLVRPPVAPNPSTILADWDDVEPAAFHALTAGECAILTTERPNSQTVVFNLRSIAADEGTLRFERPSPAPTRGGSPAAAGPDVTVLPPEPITVTAFLGIESSRDAVREGRLVAAAIARLRELAGRAWAPIAE